MNRRSATRRVWCFAAALACSWTLGAACGGTVTTDPVPAPATATAGPVGPGPGDAWVTSDAWLAPAQDAAFVKEAGRLPPVPKLPKDGGKKDASGFGWVEVDGGKDCDLPPYAAPELILTCCNGKACRGYCVLVGDATVPECNCAQITGGCPQPHVCCGNTCTTYMACKSF